MASESPSQELRSSLEGCTAMGGRLKGKVPITTWFSRLTLMQREALCEPLSLELSLVLHISQSDFRKFGVSDGSFVV